MSDRLPSQSNAAAPGCHANNEPVPPFTVCRDCPHGQTCIAFGCANPKQQIAQLAADLEQRVDHLEQTRESWRRRMAEHIRRIREGAR